MKKSIGGSMPGIRRAAASVIGAFLVFSGCTIVPIQGDPQGAPASPPKDPCTHTAQAVGTVIGAGVGLLIGSKLGHGAGAKVAGVGVGGMLGNVIGRDIDTRRCELAKIAKKYDLEMSLADVVVTPQADQAQGASGDKPAGVTSNQSSKPTQTQTAGEAHSNGTDNRVGLSVDIRDNGTQFQSGSDVLTPTARTYFAEIARQYVTPPAGSGNAGNAAKLAERKILLVGHTDDTGSSKFNADLSEHRAIAVANVFVSAGVNRDQLFVQGAGETLPIADNRTEEGRAANRRVQIVDTSDKETFGRYISSRKQMIQFYRPAAIPDSAPARLAQSDAKQGAPSPVRNKNNQTVGAAAGGKSAAPGAAAASAAAAARIAAFDFGGAPVTGDYKTADIGKPVKETVSFSIIQSAHAESSLDSVVPTCAADRPRVSNSVKSYANLKEAAVSEYFPGLYGTSWYDQVNGNLVGFARIVVYKDGGSPVVPPDLYIFRHYTDDVNAKPDFSAKPDVNVYRGDKALLYRAFVSGPVKCIDLVFPNRNEGRSSPSSLFYLKGDALYVAPYQAKLGR